MSALEDPQEAATTAGLLHVSPESPGITRVRRGRGFTYRTPTGRPLASKANRRRIDRLAIPPAWSEVWICPRPDGHLQAVGRDERGRRQYRYHDRWTEARGADKFDQLVAVGRLLPGLRRRVAADLAARRPGRDRVMALVVRLLDETLVRIGNPQSARDGSFGLTTLHPDHLDDRGGQLVVEFVAKGGTDQVVTIDEPALVRAIHACSDLGGDQLFCYRDEAGEVAEVRADDVNAYLREHGGPDLTARDFRTWGATVTAVGDLGPVDIAGLETRSASTGRFLEAVDVAAERLGNTRPVCRASYVHPAVEHAFESGALHEAWRRSRRTAMLDRAERTTLRILDTDRG